MERLDFLCILAGMRRVAIPLNLALSVEEARPPTPPPFNPDLVEGLVMAPDRVVPQMSPAAVRGERQREGGGESYALPTSDIIELLIPGVVRSMPAAPAWVAGMIDRRGAPLLVLSTATLLGRPATAKSTITLVAKIPGAGEVGIMVDRAI